MKRRQLPSLGQLKRVEFLLSEIKIERVEATAALDSASPSMETIIDGAESIYYMQKCLDEVDDILGTHGRPLNEKLRVLDANYRVGKRRR